MPRVITSITFDLKFDVSTTAPGVRVAFTERDANGVETHGDTSIHDATAMSLLPLTLIAGVNAAIDAQAAAVATPTLMAAKLTAASDAEERQRKAQAAADAADARVAAATAQLADLDAQLASATLADAPAKAVSP